MPEIMKLSREKGVVDDAGFMNIVTRVQRVTEGPTYPPTSLDMPKVGIPHCLVPPLANAILETYPPPLAPMPSEGVYTYSYTHSLLISNPPVAQVEANPATLFTQALPE